MTSALAISHELCPQCGTVRPVTVISRPTTIEFRGKSYSTREEFLLCQRCHTEFDHPSLFDPLPEIYAQYRAEHKIPGPEDLVRLRQAFGLNAAELAERLHTNELTIRLYEAGALMTEEHANLVRWLRDVTQVARRASLQDPSRPSHASLIRSIT